MMKKILAGALFLTLSGSILTACSDVQATDQLIHEKLMAQSSLQTSQTQTQQAQEINDQESQQISGDLPPQTQETPAPKDASTIVPIIMFHYVRTVEAAKDPLGYNLSIEPQQFEKILQYLSTNGYHTIHVEDIIKGWVPPKSIILTFDDGYEDFYTTARPLLQKYGFTASEGIITGKMDGVQYMSPDQVKEIDKEGFEILSHTVHHTDLNTDPNQKSEIFDSKAYLEKLLNKTIDTLVYPAGRYDNTTLGFTKDAGYKVALTTKPGYAELSGDMLQLHRIRIDNRDGYLGFIKKLNFIP